MHQNEVAESVIQYLGYPFRMLNIMPEKITSFYRKIYAKGQKKGFMPVLVNADQVLEDFLDIDDDAVYSPHKTLLNLTDGKQFLQHALQQLSDYDEAAENFSQMEEMPDISQNAFHALYSHEGRIVLFELPTVNPWEVPAYVPFSGFHDCPNPEEMTSVCKYWFDEYHAVPAAITHDTLEFLLPEPVPPEKALMLAKEQYAFCPDICDMGIPLAMIAEMLKRSTVWQFWWS